MLELVTLVLELWGTYRGADRCASRRVGSEAEPKPSIDPNIDESGSRRAAASRSTQAR